MTYFQAYLLTRLDNLKDVFGTLQGLCIIAIIIIAIVAVIFSICYSNSWEEEGKKKWTDLLKQVRHLSEFPTKDKKGVKMNELDKLDEKFKKYEDETNAKSELILDVISSLISYLTEEIEDLSDQYIGDHSEKLSNKISAFEKFKSGEIQLKEFRELILG